MSKSAIQVGNTAPESRNQEKLIKHGQTLKVRQSEILNIIYNTYTQTKQTCAFTLLNKHL